MAQSFLDLPVELRLSIYSLVLGTGTAVLESSRQVEPPSFLPANASITALQPRSAQLLRVCKTIYFEAEPLLYSKTAFCTTTQAFAGRLPTQLTDGNPIAAKIRKLTWQMSCDLLKHFYIEDMTIENKHLVQLDSLELRCQSENWKDSFCGAWVDREDFVRGRNEMIEYARIIKTRMRGGSGDGIYLVENQAQLDRGRVILRLESTNPLLNTNEILIEDLT